jgi:hypothetical protein
MRRIINARLSNVRDTEQVKRAKTLLTMRICELDYPTLKPRKRARAIFGNFSRKWKLRLSTAL